MRSIEVKGTARTIAERSSEQARALKEIRNNGGVPCVLYGGEEVVHFTVTNEGLRNLVYTPHIYVVDLVIDGKKVNAILVDEAQFLSPEEVDALSDIVDFYEIPVLCYGLRTDFLNHLFPGSRRLMEIADVIEEVPTVCWCGKRAQCNTRYSNGKIVREGAQIMLGSNESYVALCRKHYKEGKLWK